MDRDAVGERRADERARRLGEENAPAAAGGREPCRTDDVDAEVALRADRRLAGVQAHPHADALAARPLVLLVRALSVDRGDHGVPRPGERVEEGVALRVDLHAARAR